MESHGNMFNVFSSVSMWWNGNNFNRRFKDSCLSASLMLSTQCLRNFLWGKEEFRFLLQRRQRRGSNCFSPTVRLRTSLAALCEKPYLVLCVHPSRPEGSLKQALQWRAHRAGNPTFPFGSAWRESPTGTGNRAFQSQDMVSLQTVALLDVFKIKLST